MNDSKERCSNCRFWFKIFKPIDKRLKTQIATGDCRRYPPMPLQQFRKLDDVSQSIAITHDWYWCGEWKPIPSPEPTLKWSDFTQTLSVRARKTLVRLCVEDFNALTQVTYKQFDEAKNCGPTTIHEITLKASHCGLEKWATTIAPFLQC